MMRRERSIRAQLGALLVLSTSALALAASGPASAGGVGGVGNALEITQLANLAELTQQSIDVARQVENQIEMIANQVRQITTAIQTYENLVANTLSLPEQVWGEIAGELMALREAIRQGQSLAYTIANIDEVVAAEFQKFAEYEADPIDVEQFVERYRGWSDRNMDTIGAVLRSTGMNIEQFDTEEGTLAAIRAANTSESRNALLQAANNVGVEQIGQMQKLRKLVADQIALTAAYQARLTTTEAAREAERRRYYEPPEAVRGDDEQF